MLFAAQCRLYIDYQQGSLQARGVTATVKYSLTVQNVSECSVYSREFHSRHNHPQNTKKLFHFILNIFIFELLLNVKNELLMNDKRIL